VLTVLFGLAAIIFFGGAVVLASELHDVRRAYDRLHAEHARVAAAYYARTRPAVRQSLADGLTALDKLGGRLR
jgi:hypothetical protein